MMANVFQTGRAAARVLAIASVLALSACASSPPSHFYTLAPSVRAASAVSVSSPAALIDLQSVSVPAEADRKQLVVRLSETQVEVLEDERWASSLSEEIRAALSIAASQRLNEFGLRRPAHEGNAPTYRITVDVQRFESWLGARVVVDAVWRIRAPGEDGATTCRSTVFEPVGAGYDALADGHRRALTTIAGQMASVVRDLAYAADGPHMTTSNHSSTVQCPPAATRVASAETPARVTSIAGSRLAQ